MASNLILLAILLALYIASVTCQGPGYPCGMGPPGYAAPPIIIRDNDRDRDILYPFLLLMLLGVDGF